MSKTNGHRDPNVTSLDEARKRAAEKAKAEKRGGKPWWRGPPMPPSGPRTSRDWILGGVVIVMAIGLLVWFAMKMMGRVA